MIYLKLYYEFFKTGLFAIGGGMATIPFLSEMSKTLGWFSKEELSNMIAISESTPGPIGINVATYAGYKVGGILGSICATLGEVSPAIIIIILIAKFLNDFKNSPYIKASFQTIRPTVFGLVLNAFMSIFTSAVIFIDKYNETNKISDLLNIKTIFIFILIFYLFRKFKLHPIFYVLLSGILGIILKL